MLEQYLNPQNELFRRGSKPILWLKTLGSELRILWLRDTGPFLKKQLQLQNTPPRKAAVQAEFRFQADEPQDQTDLQDSLLGFRVEGLGVRGFGG